LSRSLGKIAFLAMIENAGRVVEVGMIRARKAKTKTALNNYT